MGVSGEAELLSPGSFLPPVRKEADETGMVILPQSEMDLGGVVRTVGLDHGLPRLPASGGLLCRQDELTDKNRETDRNGAGKAFFLRPGAMVGGKSQHQIALVVQAAMFSIPSFRDADDILDVYRSNAIGCLSWCFNGTHNTA
jgi:hypothetical protein